MGTGPAWAEIVSSSGIIVLHSTFFWAGLYSHIFHLKWAGLYQHIFHMKWAGLYQHIFHLKWAGFDKHFVYSRWAGLDLTRTFFIRNGLYSTIRLFLSNWTGLIWLFLFVSGARNTKCTELGSFSRRSTKYPVLLSFSTLSIKQNRLAVAERNLMEFVKPAVSCPIECNRLLVCVRISCGFRRACPRATASRLSARSGVRMARALWQQACPLASCKQFSRELLQADCSCLALRRRPPPAAAATAPGTVACSGSSGPGGLQQ